MYNINYETIEPLQLMQVLKWNKDKERIEKILNLGIFKVTDWTLVIPSYKCVINKSLNAWKDLKQISSFFPFHHQIFWFELQITKDLDFAISEVKRILSWERQYVFPNWTMVVLK